MDTEAAIEQAAAVSEGDALDVFVPRSGLLYSEKGDLTEVLCKPKIMAIKSIILEKIEKMESDAASMPGTRA